MAIFDFKSSGKTVQKTAAEAAAVAKIDPPLGIMTPLRVGSERAGVFEVHYSLKKQLADNFRNLLLTNHGQRLGRHDFGANLYPLTLEYSNDADFDQQAINRIKEATARWMPYIDLRTFESNVVRKNNKTVGIVTITITYGIPTIGPEDSKTVVTLYVTLQRGLNGKKRNKISKAKKLHSERFCFAP